MKCKYKFNCRIGEAYIFNRRIGEAYVFDCRIGEAYVFDCEHCMKRVIILKKYFWRSHA